MPFERTRSVIYTRNFLLDLCDPSKTPRVPSYVRDDARRLLKHYPSDYDMENIEESFGLLKNDYT